MLQRPRCSHHLQDEGFGELEVLDLLARRRVKGRGAIGSRADEPGPFLPPGAEGERSLVSPQCWRTRLSLAPPHHVYTATAWRCCSTR